MPSLTDLPSIVDGLKLSTLGISTILKSTEMASLRPKPSGTQLAMMHSIGYVLLRKVSNSGSSNAD